MENLSIQLHKEALGLGLCDQWSGEWMDEDGQQELIDRYKKGINFAIKHDWPSPEFIERSFDRDILHKNFIWNDEKIEWNDDSLNGDYIVNGKCTGRLEFGWYTFVTVYVRHDSNITINCTGSSKVIVCLYDNARVRISTSEGAKASVVLHGNSCSYKADGNVTARVK